MAYKHFLLLHTCIMAVLLASSHTTDAIAQNSSYNAAPITLLPDSPYTAKRAQQRKPQRVGTANRPMRVPSQQTLVTAPNDTLNIIDEPVSTLPPPEPVQAERLVPPPALPAKPQAAPQPMQTAAPVLPPAPADDAPPTVKTLPSAKETYYALPDNNYTPPVAQPRPPAEPLKAAIEKEPSPTANTPPPLPAALPAKPKTSELPPLAFEEPQPQPPTATNASASPAALPPLNKATGDKARPYSVPGAEHKTAKSLPLLSPATEDAKNIQARAALAPETKRIAEKIPANINPKASKKKPAPIAIDRVAEGQKLELDDEIKTHEALGIKIEVKKPAYAVHQELERAYQALMAGQEDLAVSIYNEVLAHQPNNSTALLGLATTYHRQGKTSMARPLYGKLLAKEPKNKEALNNFLALMAEESPEAALAELQKLEKTNADFSPIHAQMAIIYDKLGQPDTAIERLKKAVAYSPENLSYQYDLAIMLDKNKRYAEAGLFYRQLINASERGEKIPGDIEAIRQRLIFIASHTS